MVLAFLLEEPRNELVLEAPWREWDAGLHTCKEIYIRHAWDLSLTAETFY